MKAVKRAKQMIKNGEASCVIIKNNQIIHSVSGRGVGPLISIYENKPEVLQDSFVVDKIIGKAAAVIIVLGGAERIYGEIMSTSAYDLLKDRNCEVEYGKMVDNIINRSGDGMCPLEKSVLDIEGLETAFYQIKKTLNKLRSDG